MKKTITAILSCLIMTGTSQELKRKAQLGVRFAPGFNIQQVFEGNTASEAGLEVGDSLISINGILMPDVFGGKLDLREGDKVDFLVYRNGTESHFKTKAIGKPLESSDKWDVIYGSVPFGDGHLRTIVTKPKGAGPHPTIMFIPGFSCLSLDNLPAFHPYRKVVDQLTELGYCVYRVEKPGMGDCMGTPACQEIDFPTEVEAFEVGFKDMMTKSYVDKENVFMFGHSLGGIVAPFISAKHDLKGVIVYGTSHEPWHEYLLQMVRFQNPRFGEDYVKVEENMDLYWKLFYGLCKLDKSPEEMVQENEAYGPLMETALFWDGNERLLGRHYRFNGSIEDMNATEAWSKTDEHVLAMYAEADFEAIDPRATKNIVRIVNTYHPGQGTYLYVEDTDHSMIKTGSMEETLEIKNTPKYRDIMLSNDGFNTEVPLEIHEWIQGLE